MVFSTVQCSYVPYTTLLTLGSLLTRRHGVELRFVLTSYSDWTPHDGDDWNVNEFVCSVLDFAFNNAAWVEELLAWWNKYVCSLRLS